MSKTATDLARTAFTHVGPRSPLKQRDGAGQACLWALLKTYSAIQPYAEGPENDLMELAARTAAEGARFAAKLDAHVFGGPAADLLKTFFPQFAGLPLQLRALSALLNLDGKPDSKKEVFANQFLITASEFVRLKLGKYYDEHVAELYQGISERDVRRDFSADAIRKKRDRLLTQYPHVYAEALEMAKNCAQGCN